jgi:SAM-dependent methyltransferase
VPAVPPALLDAATRPYRRAGQFAYHFARGKLSGDPVFARILELGLLQGRSRVLDLGCGQGLLTAWLRAAEDCAANGVWPERWAAAPVALSTRGIELKARDVERARRALGADSEFLQGDICTAPLGSADAAVILDVLHYIPPAMQRQVLQRVRGALPDDGLLLLRVGDAGAGPRFRYSQLIDRLALLARGHGWAALYCRTLTEWRSLLDECGFDSASLPMSDGTFFANVLLVGRARGGPPRT